jgi:UDP-N-acetylglucosamine--N-acetylmuramyl-(pentapeptide) pyrophosphoryl-undecaprenol N-acetylglucosamine transferase
MGDVARILFAGGGTGGHLYPGLAVADAMMKLEPETEIRFYVTRRAIDRQVLAAHPYAAEFVDVRGFAKKPWTWPGLALSMLRNRREARRYLEEFRPQAVVGLGGFGSYAATRAAQRLGLPNFVLNPDLVVGRANRRLARRATAVFVQFAETAATVRTRGQRRGRASLCPVEVVGCPIRESLFGIDRAEACRKLELDQARKTLVVTGASLGARSVNQAVVMLAERWAEFADWQILHLTGRENAAEVRAAVGSTKPFYHVRDYVEEMGLVYAATDLIVARSGAGSVAEIVALGLPSVLVPYPYHGDRHQERHAELLASSGAAEIVLDRCDARANAEALWPVLSKLMKDADRRKAMAAAAKKLGHPEAARSVAEMVLRSIDTGTERA